MTGKRSRSDSGLDDSTVADDSAPTEPELKHVTEAHVRVSKKTKRCQAESRLCEYISKFHHLHDGIDASSELLNIPYDIWNDNSSNSLIGKFSHWLTEHARQKKNPNIPLSYRFSVQLASTLKEYICDLHKNKYVLFSVLKLCVSLIFV